jgi:endonuclease/exonuclease/phosphatase family metal-dependent hydrolase
MLTRSNCLTLVTHNAYWFQGAPSLWGEERTQAHDAVMPLLARLYGRLDTDILCLQEVPSSAVLSTLRTELGMQGAFFPGGKRSAYGGAMLWQGMATSVEELTHTAEDVPVFERICLQLNTSIQTRSITVIGVHLASNRFAPERQGEPIRLAELETLFAACPEPDVVMGDFNATSDSGVYARMVEQGFIDCGHGYTVHGRPPDKRIDYIWIRAAAGLSVLEYEVIQDQRFVYDADAGIYLSDHHPVRVCLRLD